MSSSCAIVSVLHVNRFRVIAGLYIFLATFLIGFFAGRAVGWFGSYITLTCVQGSAALFAEKLRFSLLIQIIP